MQRKSFTILWRVASFVWKLFALTVSVKWIICNPSCVAKCVFSLQKLLTQLKGYLVMANVIYLAIKIFIKVKFNVFLNILVKNHILLLFLLLNDFLCDLWITSIRLFNMVKKFKRTTDSVLDYHQNERRQCTLMWQEILQIGSLLCVCLGKCWLHL